MRTLHIILGQIESTANRQKLNYFSRRISSFSASFAERKLLSACKTAWSSWRTGAALTENMEKSALFPVVFLYGMDKGRLPLEIGTADTGVSIEEERRLCYVGMTRAQEELLLICGQKSSCFLQEIPEKYIKRERPQKTEDEETDKTVQMSLFDFM